jgi:UDP-glucose:(heptosyl)LPS alpha-1,3-glucosyltransferase
VQIARRVAEEGHTVKVFTSRIEGDVPPDIEFVLLPNRAFSNHGRNACFAADFIRATAGRFDCHVGFDKLPGLDRLYCADPCQVNRHTSPLLRLLPRYRTLCAHERACFAEDATVHIMLLSQQQMDDYRAAWRTPSERLTLLPPTLDVRRRQPELRFDGTRNTLRNQLGIMPGTWLWLGIAAYAWTKGIDRTLQALAQFQSAHLILVGMDSTSRQGRMVQRIAHRLGVSSRLTLLGHSENIPALMAAADVLVHPARLETTGTAILEAVVNGLPVLTTSVCGYAHHVAAAKAGIIIDEPFDAMKMNHALATLRDPVVAAAMGDSGRRYADDADIYSGLERAVDIIVGK